LSDFQTVTWSEVESVLLTLSLGRTHDRSDEWAHEAWVALEKADLTQYSGRVEYHRVLCRGLTLMAMYREFARLAWDEILDVKLVDWATDLGVLPFRLGQIVGCEENLDDDSDADDLFREGLRQVVDSERFDVYHALLGHFDGESMVFASLYATSWESSWVEGSEALSLVEILANDKCLPELLAFEGFGKMPAFEWVTEGMPRLD
jgi:hypothetical protein